MEKYELQKLRDLPIEGVAERLGLRVSRHKSLCPFHNDHHASLSFKVSKNSWRCFVCGASGGTIDLVMKYLGNGFREACRWLADENNIILTEYKPQTSDLGHQPSFDASRYERFFERPWLNDEARRFLYDERKLDPRVVAWCRLTSWKDRQGVPWLQIPYYNREGKLIGIQNRNLAYGSELNHEPFTMNREPRFRFPSGSQCSIYNLPVKRKDAALLRELMSTLQITIGMYPDNDVPGERLFLQLKEVLPHLVHYQLPPGHKDFSDYYVSIKRKEADHG